MGGGVANASSAVESKGNGTATLLMSVWRCAACRTWEDPIEQLQESDWPGGLQQRHRYLRPLVESLLEGYGAEFVGLLEDDADALGAWRTTADITAVSQVPLTT